MKDIKRTRTTLANGPHEAVLTQTGIDGASLVITMAKADGGLLNYLDLYTVEEQALIIQVLRASGWTVTRTEILEEEIQWEDSVSVTVDCDADGEVEL